MLLTVSKRLEFSASRRLQVKHWSDRENLAAFGPETGAHHGTGRNYVAYFVFTGPVNPSNGMLINISEIKERAGKVVREHFDHKFLNEDNHSFREVPPTPENIANQLYIGVAPLFSDADAKLVACHLSESPDRSTTFYSNGTCDANYWFEFSAARRTVSPHLSEQENARFFGKATSIHGHNYRVRLTFRTEKLTGEMPVAQFEEVDACLRSLHSELDHRYLNQEVPGLKDRPITTESLAGYIYQRVNANLSRHPERCPDRPDFFSKEWNEKPVFLGFNFPFPAPHHLYAAALSDAENPN